MKYSLIMMLTAFMLMTTMPSCRAKYGCPGNPQNYNPKKKKKNKLEKGMVPEDYAKKRGITGKAD